MRMTCFDLESDYFIWIYISLKNLFNEKFEKSNSSQTPLFNDVTNNAEEKDR